MLEEEVEEVEEVKFSPDHQSEPKPLLSQGQALNLYLNF